MRYCTNHFLFVCILDIRKKIYISLNQPHFSLFVSFLSNRLKKKKILLTVGFDLRLSGVGSNRFASCATTNVWDLFLPSHRLSCHFKRVAAIIYFPIIKKSRMTALIKPSVFVSWVEVDGQHHHCISLLIVSIITPYLED